MIASCFSCKERLRPALGLEARRRGPVAPCAGMARTVPAPARSGAWPVSWPNADAPSWWRKTPYVVQGARARLRDLALQLSILRRIPSRQAATGPSPGANTAARRRGLVKGILSATPTDPCAIRHIRTCTSMALLDGYRRPGREFHELSGKLLFSNASRILCRSVFALGLTQVPT